MKWRYFIAFFIGFLAVTFIYPRFTKKPLWTCANSISCQKSLVLKVENGAEGIFYGHKVMAPSVDLSKELNQNVLGAETPQINKHIYVDLTHQTLFAFQNKQLFLQARISSGKWHPTPTGDFTIWSKVRATRMTGGEGADFYDLPNVPYVMFFGNSVVPDSAGFSLHGAYWHDNFGHPMSHGCVNMRAVDAQKLFSWADTQGIQVTIYGDAPL